MLMKAAEKPFRRMSQEPDVTIPVAITLDSPTGMSWYIEAWV